MEDLQMTAHVYCQKVTGHYHTPYIAYFCLDSFFSLNF